MEIGYINSREQFPPGEFGPWKHCQESDVRRIVGDNDTALKIAAMSRDPKQSKVDGKVGYALHPVSTRCGSEAGGFAVGIPANSKNQEAAFLFIQYITSKAGDRRMVELGGDPVRMSTIEHFKDQFAEYPVILEQLPCADFAGIEPRHQLRGRLVVDFGHASLSVVGGHPRGG